MDKYTAMLKELECPVCLEYMVDEISQCGTGHSFCRRCRANLLVCPLCKVSLGNTVTRNYTLEAMISNLTLPCKNTGCGAVLDARLIKAHSKNCPLRDFKCALDFNGCTWSGKMTDLKEHVGQRHNENINTWAVTNNLLFMLMFCSEEIFVVLLKSPFVSPRIHSQQLYGHTIAVTSLSYARNNPRLSLNSQTLHEISGMYMGTSNKTNDYFITVNYKDTTNRGYGMQVTAPCIPQCPIEEAFNGDKISFDTADKRGMFSKCFYTNPVEKNIIVTIRDYQDCSYLTG